MEEENLISSSSTTNIKLIIEKGPKAGESFESESKRVIKIGRVATGNTLQIIESAISSHHVSIRLEKPLNIWMLTDLDSTNGTILNAEKLEPNVANALKDGDCIKIGELTSIIVKIEKHVVESRRKNTKRNLRGHGKKALDTKNVVESASSKKVTQVPELGEETTTVEPKNTLPGRKKKLLPVKGTGLDEQKLAEAVPVAVAVEPLKRVETSVIEDDANEKNTEPDGLDVEKMTIDDIFDYIEARLPD